MVSLDSIAPEDDDGGAIRHERTVGLPLKNCSELATIKSASVPFKSSRSGRPHLPWHMRDVVFDATTRSLSRIAPVVFGDELFQTPVLRKFGKAYGSGRELAPPVANLPSVLGRIPERFCLEMMLHRETHIVLAVHESGGHRDRVSRHNLRDENDSSSIISVFLATNIEAQVYLIEIGMKRNSETPK